jgi:hypothetical protein
MPFYPCCNSRSTLFRRSFPESTFLHHLRGNKAPWCGHGTYFGMCRRAGSVLPHCSRSCASAKKGGANIRCSTPSSLPFAISCSPRSDTPVTTRSALSTLRPVGHSAVAPLVGVAIWYPQPDLWTSLASTASRPVTVTKATAQASICEGRFLSRCGSGQPDGSDRRGTWGGAGVTQSR